MVPSFVWLTWLNVLHDFGCSLGRPRLVVAKLNGFSGAATDFERVVVDLDYILSMAGFLLNLTAYLVHEVVHVLRVEMNPRFHEVLIAATVRGLKRARVRPSDDLARKIKNLISDEVVEMVLLRGATDQGNYKHVRLSRHLNRQLYRRCAASMSEVTLLHYTVLDLLSEGAIGVYDQSCKDNASRIVDLINAHPDRKSWITMFEAAAEIAAVHIIPSRSA
jgi:hypothetical protein